jgi:hypothetical protein
MLVGLPVGLSAYGGRVVRKRHGDYGNYGATIVSEETILTASSRHFVDAPIEELGSGGLSEARRAAAFKRPAALEAGHDLVDRRV